jgi:hypothetical protein
MIGGIVWKRHGSIRASEDTIGQIKSKLLHINEAELIELLGATGRPRTSHRAGASEGHSHTVSAALVVGTVAAREPCSDKHWPRRGRISVGFRVYRRYARPLGFGSGYLGQAIRC